jgi:hypothetical protein
MNSFGARTLATGARQDREFTMPFAGDIPKAHDRSPLPLTCTASDRA